MVFKRPLSLLLILFALGCSKNPQIQREEPDVIQEARYYFEKNILVKNAFSNARIEGSFTHGDPRWDDATTRQLSRGTIVQVPLSVDSVQGVTFENHVLPLRYKDYLLIYKDKDSVYRNIVMRNIRTGSLEPGYSGLTLVQDWSGSNPGSFAMEGGKLITTNSPTNGRITRNSDNYAIRSCVTINYYYSVNGGPWQYNFSNTYCTGSAGPDSPGDNGPGEWQELPPPEGGGGGGEGGTTPGNLEPPPVILKDIRNSLTSPCISTALAELTLSNLTSYIADLLKICLETDHSIDAHFFEGPATDFPDPFHDGKTTGGKNGIMDRDIYLDIKINSAIGNGSKEYVTATIIHEIVHGYFRIEYGQGSDPWDHGQMVGNDYINKMTYALKEIFPDLSDSDARALVWIGLQETDAYKDKPLNEKNAIEYTALNYRTGLSGTKCN